MTSSGRLRQSKGK
ncbi:unnamed protein product, partial [Rotaria sordida]